MKKVHVAVSFVAANLMMAGLTAHGAVPADTWKGKSGGDLLIAVGKSHTPQKYVERLDGADGIWEMLKVTDGDGGEYVNRFSDECLPYGVNGGAPGNLEMVRIAEPRWWRGVSENYISVNLDLLNQLPAPAGVSVVKQTMPPGVVDKAVTDNGVWRTGSGVVGAVRISMWEPPVELQGDVARMMMYAAAVYMEGVMRYESCGGAVWSEVVGEGFTPAYVAQLLVWHRNDPPSDYERLRNEVFGGAQGNSNPFVEYPDLAEYLWGDMKGESYGTVATEEPDVPVPDTTPLRAEYGIGEERINLVTPIVPADARWELDGDAVERDYLVPAEIGPGVHELRFYSSSLNGMVKILVK